MQSETIITSDLNIIYEDNHIIAVNKTQHDLVQKDVTGDQALDDKLKDYIRDRYSKPGNVFLGVAHRLDRPVTGVVLFARTSKALTRLTKMFRNGEVEKTYWAIVKQKPRKDSEKLTHYITRNTSKNKSYCSEKPKPGSKESILSYRLIGQSDRYYLLEIKLETGRHHQIRAQLAYIGSSIKGDLKYGFPRSNTHGGISLHARKINFVHPVTKQETEIIADLPDGDIWSAFRIL